MYIFSGTSPSDSWNQSPRIYSSITLLTRAAYQPLVRSLYSLAQVRCPYISYTPITPSVGIDVRDLSSRGGSILIGLWAIGLAYAEWTLDIVFNKESASTLVSMTCYAFLYSHFITRDIGWREHLGNPRKGEYRDTLITFCLYFMQKLKDPLFCTL